MSWLLTDPWAGTILALVWASVVGFIIFDVFLKGLGGPD